MKNIFLLLTLLSFSAFSQITIEKADGSRINASKARFDTENQRLIYTSNGKKEKLKFKTLKEVSTDQFKFRYFPNAKKIKGFFIKTESPTKTLGFVAYRSASGSSTGFREALPNVVISVFDKQGQIIETYKLNKGRSEKDIQQRSAVISSIKSHFQDCPNFINDFTTFLSKEADASIWNLFTYFKDESFQQCN